MDADADGGAASPADQAPDGDADFSLGGSPAYAPEQAPTPAAAASAAGLKLEDIPGFKVRYGQKTFKPVCEAKA